MRLYVDGFWISPYAFSAFVALTEKGAPFETTEVALEKGEQRQGTFPVQSFTGRIPCLVDGTFWLAESSAIAEYLEDKFPAPKHPALLPPSLTDRARARMVMAFVRSDLGALREERPTTTMFYEPAKQPLSPAGQAAADKLIRFTEALLPAGRNSLFGAWTIADADLAFMLQRLMMNGHKVPSRIGAFVEEQWARPSVRIFADRQRAPYKPY
jgi:glutathione S-transferase